MFGVETQVATSRSDGSQAGVEKWPPPCECTCDRGMGAAEPTQHGLPSLMQRIREQISSRRGGAVSQQLQLLDNCPPAPSECVPASVSPAMLNQMQL